MPAFVQVAARPMSTENTSALITSITGGMESWNTTSGSSFSPSTLGLMDSPGMIANPAAMENRAAPREDA